MQEPHNISLYPGNGSLDGNAGDHVLLAPAYTSTEHDIRHIAAITARVIREFFSVKGLVVKQQTVLVSTAH
jgi:hypothetical protein